MACCHPRGANRSVSEFQQSAGSPRSRRALGVRRCRRRTSRSFDSSDRRLEPPGYRRGVARATSTPRIEYVNSPDGSRAGNEARCRARLSAVWQDAVGDPARRPDRRSIERFYDRGEEVLALGRVCRPPMPRSDDPGRRAGPPFVECSATGRSPESEVLGLRRGRRSTGPSKPAGLSE